MFALCPFCGSNKIASYSGSGCYFVKCEECGAQGPSLDYYSDVPNPGTEVANLWNRRVLHISVDVTKMSPLTVQLFPKDG